ncbi:MAG TPA: PP0621 family protein [Candidatus Limnocylindrales bacterium]|nr:PP0621 family protein [Candidatus Limnocylindrales bacterium]
MTLLRLAFLFIIIYIVYSALKPLLQGGAKPANPAQLGEQMVLDPQCQTYVPKSDAVIRQGKFFCSEECAQRYLAG